MRREGRLHGYEFDREQSHTRVKACNQPTNRSKFRSKHGPEKVGRPRYKALKKIKGQRNKAQGADVAANYRLHEWAFKPSNGERRADTTDDVGVDADVGGPRRAQGADVAANYRLHEWAFKPSNSELRADTTDDVDVDPDQQLRVVLEEIRAHDDDDEQNEGEDSNGSDWLDLGSTDGSEDDWYLC